MARVGNFRATKVILLFLVLVLFASAFLLCVRAESESRNGELFRRGRRILESVEEDEPKKKKSSDALPTKTQNNKLIKAPTQSSKNQTKLIKNSLSTKNKTMLGKTTNSTKLTSSGILKVGLKKLNSTAKLNYTSKSSNSTKTTSLSAKKSSDLLKISTPKNKTTTPNSSKQSQTTHLDKTNKEQKSEKKPNEEKPKKQVQAKAKPSWVDDDEDDDLVSEFRDLPTKFQKTLIPDLARISTTSKAYITKANKQMTMGFKPIVGNKYASTIASLTSFAFILIPLILVSLLFNRIKAYFSLQKLLIFIQVYLAIYFGILCLSSVVTGLEPLKFFYATSQSTYICLQVMQTLGYILYLLLLVMYLVLVFSTDCGLGSRMLGLAQTFVGYAVGLHYYVSVFHRMVLHQPPRTNWKIHGIYATCFLVICGLAGAERRKKSYLEEDGTEGKKS
ncbi:putative Mediator of RNA polymerase II transcription subunit 26 [Cucumis melo var. makuwa]|uniref:Mediator of RNA polymerase II transcription subunit 26 n=2 Tax=Cucumis melo TaxID=3656 RepID=A0A5A7T3Z1_CUCMM|nr:putative Mediator of RNA polymerase II transcription subunit 26 [Cucumis melo var. makuwa]TYK12691.1 putative Mediator of RNA polymerase II transcription subunit 26 [Cucumis melo var. makuwa]